VRSRNRILLVAALVLVGLIADPVLADQPQDAWITTKVKMTLLTADRIDPFTVDVDTIDGVVTLHGQVATNAAKDDASERAMKIDGVRDVHNLLVVVPEKDRPRVAASDDQIRTQVETVLARDQALDQSEVEVDSVNDGVVVLAGHTDTLSAHRRALEDARSVEGVRRVASEIQSPDELGDRELWDPSLPESSGLRASASDTWITTKAKVRLMTEAKLSPFAINVDTRNAVVTLFGTVDSERTREAAAEQVKKIAGVKGVENELQVVPDVAAARVEAEDAEIQGAVERRLADHEALRDADIDVEVSNGVVRLSGTVQSFGDRLTALTVARSTSGVDSLVDDLRLEKSRG
jgi:hyperosmotically inducible periplasmic protein